MRKKLFVDMDGTVTEWRIIQSEDELYEKGYFKSLAPSDRVIHAVETAMAAGVDVYILSCVLPDSAYALDEKKEWIRNHMPYFDDDHLLFVPYGKNKADFVKERFGITSLSEDEILLDDYSLNLHAWCKENGKGIKVMNGFNGSKGSWKGLRLAKDGKEEDLLNAI